MAKAVLISIQPQWCERIARGEKTVEIRKTRPKIETPFKCYVYRTKGVVKHIAKGEWFDMPVGGTVIGEFTCDRITPLFNVCTDNWHHLAGDVHEWHKELVKRACLTDAELKAYAKGQNCFAWHISDLKIYDTPKQLNEFWLPPERYCEKERCGGCPYDQVADVNGEYSFDCEWKRPLTRPPQSWCYVEEQRWPYVNLL